MAFGQRDRDGPPEAADGAPHMAGRLAKQWRFLGAGALSGAGFAAVGVSQASQSAAFAAASVMALSAAPLLSIFAGGSTGLGAAGAQWPVFRRPILPAGRTPVSRMRGFWGVLTAYWVSERWTEAWALTVGVFALTTLLSKSSVWAATASADFLNSLVKFHRPAEGVDPVSYLLTATAAFAAIHLGRIGGSGIRHLCSATLHRKARLWTQRQFSEAILARHHIAASLMSDRGGGASAHTLPDNIDQRVDECTAGVFAGAIGLAMGVWGSVASIYFISVAVLERSVAIPALDAWGTATADWADARLWPGAGAWVDFSPGAYGSAVLVLLVLLVYVPVGTYVAWCLGRVLERQTMAKQQSDGTWRGEFNAMLGRSSQLAASQGQRVQARVNDRLYGAVDRVWHRLNATQMRFTIFTNAYTFLSTRLVGYLPALPAFMSGGMSFRSYSATSELVGELINDTSWFIHVMPAIATLKANARRLTDVAEAIEAAQDRSEFYGRTGISDFRYTTQDPRLGLTLRDLALHHRGFDAPPFLRARALTFRPGQWTYVRGRNGCGKSSLMKAVAGLWPYGSGEIVEGEGSRLFFAGQDADLPERLTLRELVCYPDFEDRHDDRATAAALSDVGLGPFIREMDAPLHHGKPWAGVFSGGQRQRLVLARILLQCPDVLLLDEACSAMDPAAVSEFHLLIRQHCPDAVVISIMHEPEMPRDPDGRPFYDTLLLIEDGEAALRPIGSEAMADRILAAE